jgi:hypothetical protein
VDYPIWDFIDVSDYIYPVLHGEIGLANALLESFYDFLDEKVEVLSEEEVLQQNCTIIKDVAFEKAEQRLKDWFKVEGSNLQIHHKERTVVNRQLKQKNISDERKNDLREEKMELEQEINQLAAERKELESDASILQKAFA